MLRIAMKRILSMFICITLLLSMEYIVYSNDTATLPNSYVFLTRTDVDGCVKAVTAGNYKTSTTTVSKVTNNNYEAYVKSWALMKYDISAYSIKDIQKVEIVTASNNKNTGSANIYEVYSDWNYDDTSLSYNTTPITKITLNYEAGTETSQTSRGFKPINTNADYGKDVVGEKIYNELGKYEAAFDLTEYVKEKIAEGDTTISLAFGGVSGSYVAFTNISMLITYKDNQLPKIDISDNVTKVRQGESIVFTANVNDPDTSDTINSVIFKIGDEIELEAELIDGVYTTSEYDTSDLEGGEYTVMCCATDSKGGVSYKSMVVKVGGIPQTTYYFMTSESDELTCGNYNAKEGNVSKVTNKNYEAYVNSWALMKYDISNYSTKDIQKVEILTASNNKNTGSMNIYEVYSDWNYNDTSLLYNATPITKVTLSYEAGTETEQTSRGFKPINTNPAYGKDIVGETIYNALGKYEAAFDLTEYVKDKIEEENTTISLAFGGVSGSNVGFTNISMLITYKNNSLPVIETSYSVDDGQLVIISNITEPDDDSIENVEFTFDGETVNTNNSDNQYTYACDAMKIGTGIHTFTVSASDEWGAEKKKILVIDNTYPIEMAYASVFEAQDTSALAAALNNTEIMNLIGISNELYLEVSDKEVVAESIKSLISENKSSYEQSTLDKEDFENKADVMLNKAAILQLVKESDGKTLQGLLDKYSASFEKEEYLNITTIPAYNDLYKNWDEDIQTVICQVFVSYDINSIDDILQNLPEAIYLGGIKGTNYWGDVYEIINNNTDYFGEKNAIVNKLTNKAAVYSKMMGVSYKSYEEVKEAEAEYAQIQYQSENSSTGSTGGGGGSKKSSGGTYIPPANNNTTDTQQAKVLFDDMDQYGWVKVAVEVLAEKGIVNGVGDKKFNPSGNVKREEFIKMLVCAFEIYDADAKTAFNDIPDGNWSESYIASAEKHSLVNGVGNGIFGCGNYITREDMIVMCMNFANKFNVSFNNVDESKVLNFADSVNISDYAKTAIETMYQAGVVNGVGNNMFKPKDYCTRAEAAKVIYEIYAAK